MSAKFPRGGSKPILSHPSICNGIVYFAGNIQVNIPLTLNSTLEVVGKSVEQGEVTIQNKIEMKSDELIKVSGEL